MLSVLFSIVVVSGLVAGGVGIRAVRRDAPRSELLLAGLTVDALVLAWSACAIALVLLPDARDRLSAADRAVADPVVDPAWLCGDPLLSHAPAVSVSADRRRVEWTCAWGPLGLVRSSGKARCIDGSWEGTSFGGPTRLGPCG